MEAIDSGTAVILGGSVLGSVFGLVAQRSAFCFRAAVVELADAKLGVQSRAWLTAILVAIASTQLLVATGWIDLGATIYTAGSFAPAVTILGGLLFGFGMILAGGCTGRLLVLAASGNLRAFVVLLVAGITAYITMRGILAPARLAMIGATTVAAEARLLTVAPARLAVPLAVVTGGLVLALILTSAGNRLRVAAGAMIGSLVAGGWWVTGYLGADDFAPTPMSSLTFTAPLAEGLQYLMTWTGSRLDFGIAVLGGVIAGAFTSAALARELRWQGFTSPEQMRRYLAGGVAMGVGAVMAAGCTVGQGLSGISTLATGSLLALLSITGGALLTATVTRGIGLSHGTELSPGRQAA